MGYPRGKTAALCLTLALAAALLGGCVGAPTPAQSLAPETVIHYGLSAAWDALMPYHSPSGSNYARLIYDKIYDRLAYVHADGTVTPRGAESWESADGGYAILFYLDDRATFHDGTPVTARHWADTVALMTNPHCPALGRSNFALLTGTNPDGTAIAGETLGAQALGDYTLKLTFKAPVIPEDFLLDKNREFYVLPTHLMGETAPADVMTLPLWSAPIGSGPCVFVSEVVGSSITLAANGDYHLGAPGFDKLVISVLDKSALLTALLAGDLDYYGIGGSISAEDAEVARAAGLTVTAGTTPNIFYELMLNNETIDDARIRRAVECALDKEQLCLQTSGGNGYATNTSVLGGYPSARSYTPGLARDLTGAQALLADAGYDGREYTLATTAARAGLAALMQQQMAEAGIAVRIETVDSAALFAGMADGTFDMGIASHTPSPLPLWFTGSRLNEGNNLFRIPDTAPYAEHIAAIEGATDPSEKVALVGGFEDFLQGERPFIPLWFGTGLHVQSPTVTGIDSTAAAFSNENVWDWKK